MEGKSSFQMERFFNPMFANCVHERLTMFVHVSECHFFYQTVANFPLKY